MEELEKKKEGEGEGEGEGGTRMTTVACGGQMGFLPKAADPPFCATPPHVWHRPTAGKTRNHRVFASAVGSPLGSRPCSNQWLVLFLVPDARSQWARAIAIVAQSHLLTTSLWYNYRQNNSANFGKKKIIYMRSLETVSLLHFRNQF